MIRQQLSENLAVLSLSSIYINAFSRLILPISSIINFFVQVYAMVVARLSWIQFEEAMEKHMTMNVYWILHLVRVEAKLKKSAMENAVSNLLTSNWTLKTKHYIFLKLIFPVFDMFFALPTLATRFMPNDDQQI